MECRLLSKIIGSFATVHTEDAELDSEYVLDVGVSCDGSLWAASLSDRTVKVFSGPPGASVAPLLTQSFPTMLQVMKFSKSSPHLLYTMGSDGSIKLWDLRASGGGCVASINVSSDEDMLSMDVVHNDVLMAVSAGNSVLFYDIRSGSNNRLGQYADCHSDIVTKLKFNDHSPHILTSVGEDGLMCTYDTSAPPSSEAVVSVLNAECPIRNFFYFGDQSQGICCMSSVEALSCWHFPSAQRICNFEDIRSKMGIQYLTDGWYDGASDKLFVLGGDFEGRGMVMHIEPNDIKTVGTLTGGHTSSIRCCAHTNIAGGSQGLVTGGEDAHICVWGEPGSSGPAQASSALSSSNMAQRKPRPMQVKSKPRGIKMSSNPY